MMKLVALLSFIAAAPALAGGDSVVVETDAAAADRQAYFGELHIHTSWSFDAFVFKVQATPEDAYAFGKGGSLHHPLGALYQLDRPLDFMAVTDHGWFMGVFQHMADPDHPLSKIPLAADVTSPDVRTALGAYSMILAKSSAGEPIPGLEGINIQQSTWDRVIDIANRHNDPGRFTTFIGYEWSSTPNGANLHRNVIFAGDTAPLPFTYFDSDRPEDLWDYLDNARSGGHAVLAIPHNSNISNGLMFDTVDSDGQPLTKAYAEQRNRNEPLVEITQVKGTSETHPLLSPTDEFANFEIVDQFVGTNRPIEKFSGGYVRDALATGVSFEDEKGFNPFEFGTVGGTDSHTAIVPADEATYSGKAGIADGSAEVRLLSEHLTMDVRKFGASGLTGIWAGEKTREALFSAMQRKETFATTGPRIRVRMFAGFGLDQTDIDKVGWVRDAYARGVPMGGTLASDGKSGAPTLIVEAMKDAPGANLDRIQIVKGWSDKGTPHEKIYDVALSDDRVPDPETGKIRPVGNSVDLSIPTYTNDIGDPILRATWTDPDFDASQHAFYYARVLEIPTPRWSVFDARRLGIEPPADLPLVIQERAFTSPIWVKPTADK